MVFTIGAVAQCLPPFASIRMLVGFRHFAGAHAARAPLYPDA